MTKTTKNFDREHKNELQKAKQQIIWFIRLKPLKRIERRDLISIKQINIYDSFLFTLSSCVVFLDCNWSIRLWFMSYCLRFFVYHCPWQHNDHNLLQF